MIRLRSTAAPGVLLLMTGVLLSSLTGCTTSSTPTAKPASGDKTAKTEAGGKSASGGTAKADSGQTTTQKFWDDAPDVPYLPVMTEVDGIPVPRIDTKAEALSLKGEVPADVDNPHAKKTPGEKTTGDWVRIRFDSEPKVLNSIIETSAVETYISGYIHEGLLRQNPETFAFEPHIASKWIAEDSIKLSPNYPGQQRRLQTDDGKLVETLEFDYTAPENPDDKPPVKTLMVVSFVSDEGEAKPLEKAWVGVYPVGKINGAPQQGYHQWTDAAGKVEVSGMPTGKYTVKTGAEIYGVTDEGEDGSLTVKPGSAENPLTAELKKSGKEALVLKKGEWQDIQRETYFTYYLRPDVKWSDGKPFTTKDLEFGYAVINNPTVDGDSLRTYYSDLIECTALSSHVVRMRYRQQYFNALEFTYALSGISPPFHLFEGFFKGEKPARELTLERLTEEQEKAQNKISAHGAAFGKFFNTDPRYNTETPLGTGPYVFGSWERGNRIELNRNKDYWLKDRAAYLDKIVVRFIPDQVTAMAALKAGDIDFFWKMTPEQFFEDLKGPPDWFKNKYVKAKWYSPMFTYFGYNMQREQFKDRRVRLALSLLFDKQDFLEKKLYNSGVIVSGSQYYFGPGYDHEVPPVGYDPETAQELLAEAGWVDTNNDGILDKNGLAMKFVLPMPPGNPVAEERVQLFQKNLKDVGILLEVQQLEWASFIDRIRAKDFDICTLSWAMPVESDPYQIWHSSGAKPQSRGSNHVSFANPLADELIETMRVTLDPHKRHRLQYTFHRLLDQEQPYMFTFCVTDFGVYHQRFRGVKWYKLRPGFDLSEWWVPKDEQMFK